MDSPKHTTSRGIDFDSLEFNFQEWKELHEKDPLVFEKRRKFWINSIIEAAPEKSQRRLKGLMFKVDVIRERAKNPMQSCIEISRLMHDHLRQLNTTVNMAMDSNYAIGETVEVSTQATILKFPARRRS